MEILATDSYFREEVMILYKVLCLAALIVIGLAGYEGYCRLHKWISDSITPTEQSYPPLVELYTARAETDLERNTRVNDQFLARCEQERREHRPQPPMAFTHPDTASAQAYAPMQSRSQLYNTNTAIVIRDEPARINAGAMRQDAAWASEHEYRRHLAQKEQCFLYPPGIVSEERRCIQALPMKIKTSLWTIKYATKMRDFIYRIDEPGQVPRLLDVRTQELFTLDGQRTHTLFGGDTNPMPASGFGQYEGQHNGPTNPWSNGGWPKDPPQQQLLFGTKQSPQSFGEQQNTLGSGFNSSATTNGFGKSGVQGIGLVGASNSENSTQQPPQPQSLFPTIRPVQSLGQPAQPNTLGSGASGTPVFGQPIAQQSGNGVATSVGDNLQSQQSPDNPIFKLPTYQERVSWIKDRFDYWEDTLNGFDGQRVIKTFDTGEFRDVCRGLGRNLKDMYEFVAPNGQWDRNLMPKATAQQCGFLGRAWKMIEAEFVKPVTGSHRNLDYVKNVWQDFLTLDNVLPNDYR